MEIDKVCRLCGELSKKQMHSIFDKNDNGQQLVQLIKQCLPILVYRTDPLSKKICEICLQKLNEFGSFQKNTLKIHDNFKSKLLNRLDESPIKLYVNILENANQTESLQINFCRNLQPIRNFSSQFQVETRTCSTNTEAELNSPSKNLTILTPSRINEISNSNFFVSLQTEEGVAIKKRKLSSQFRAGPKCKTRPIYKKLYFHQSPPTLLQVALKQVNRNFNLFDESANSLDSFQTNEESQTTENTENGYMTEDTTDYSASASIDEESQDSVPCEGMEVIKSHPDYNYHVEVDLEEPAICNYCMKRFPNIVKLARHEIVHIKVDISPRVGSKQFNMLHTKLAFYYSDYLRRQNLLPPKEVKIYNKPVTRAVIKPQNMKSLVNETLDIQEETTTNQNLKPVPPTEVSINYEEPEEEDPTNNLLIPTNSSFANHEFKIENNEILVNGILLRSMDKAERRNCFKSVVINGLKRKFCPLCRYTFKDNWAIENHYMSGVCMYTCKYCGRKFKYHKELFEDHLKTHKGETATKIFGPRDRQIKLRRKRLIKTTRSVFVNQTSNIYTPKVKPLKMKQLMQKRDNDANAVLIKTEPHSPGQNQSAILEASTSQNSNNHNNEPYQAYFCRKCFKVFFNVTEYNTHIRCCNGQTSQTKIRTKITPTRASLERAALAASGSQDNTRVSTPDSSSSSSKRPLRSCVKDFAIFQDSDNDSGELLNQLIPPIKPQINNMEKVADNNQNGWECSICCSSFPSKYSRNSHMRIHKGNDNKKASPNLNKTTPQQNQMAALGLLQNDIRFANLNPTVARLVQNNPHLTIRSYVKTQSEKALLEQQQQQPSMSTTQMMETNFMYDAVPEQSIKRVYKCADCEEKFENKSILYYHKMNSCIVKKHYECAFCRKKFGTYDQYNMHMFHVHPE